MIEDSQQTFLFDERISYFSSGIIDLNFTPLT